MLELFSFSDLFAPSNRCSDPKRYCYGFVPIDIDNFMFIITDQVYIFAMDEKGEVELNPAELLLKDLESQLEEVFVHLEYQLMTLNIRRMFIAINFVCSVHTIW